MTADGGKAADPFDLERFVLAQAGVHEAALAELRAGRKRGHWMWFVFPQLRGLGHSAPARRYGITGRAEAAAYLAHDLLGPRLRQCTRAVQECGAASLQALFGTPDDLKFRSCMTLFRAAAEDRAIFDQALARWCAGEGDAATLGRLADRH